jgi:aspartyl-tRNA(Asn)/glutamyl-tRNA(Gln) amidotransferase subunit A
VPASYCGVAGLKPTYGRVSRYGVQPLGLTLDHIGPMAATVNDLAVALQVMTGYDPRDGSSSRLSAPVFGPYQPETIRGARVGIPENFYFDNCERQVRSAVERATRIAEKLGAECLPVVVPDVEALNVIARVILLVEASAVYESHLKAGAMFGDDVRSLLEQGLLLTGPEYVQAQRLRKVLTADFRRVFDAVDYLFVPATPITAPRIGETEVDIGGKPEDVRLASTRLVRAVNVLGFPALSMPCGETSAAMPIGLQIIGRPFEDERILAVGSVLEAGLGLRP